MPSALIALLIVRHGHYFFSRFFLKLEGYSMQKAKVHFAPSPPKHNSEVFWSVYNHHRNLLKIHKYAATEPVKITPGTVDQ